MTSKDATVYAWLESWHAIVSPETRVTRCGLEVDGAAEVSLDLPAGEPVCPTCLALVRHDEEVAATLLADRDDGTIDDDDGEA